MTHNTAKFELTAETQYVCDTRLFRIRALTAFGTVTVGTLGGFVEKATNLAQDGDAWVYGNARVYGDARVSGDADYYLQGPIGSRRDFLTVHADVKIGVRFTTGCFTGTEYQFKAAVQQTHGDSQHGTHYRAAINMALLMVKAAKTEVEAA
jgi:hypothetical protein